MAKRAVYLVCTVATSAVMASSSEARAHGRETLIGVGVDFGVLAPGYSPEITGRGCLHGRYGLRDSVASLGAAFCRVGSASDNDRTVVHSERFVVGPFVEAHVWRRFWFDPWGRFTLALDTPGDRAAVAAPAVDATAPPGVAFDLMLAADFSTPYAAFGPHFTFGSVGDGSYTSLGVHFELRFPRPEDAEEVNERGGR